VATEQKKLLGVNKPITALAALLLLTTWALTAGAQTGPGQSSRPPRPREAMSAAQDCYRQGDYETAALFYEEAQANKQQLTDQEQMDLDKCIKANNTALKASKDGSLHLRQAADALAQNKLQEASAAVKAESTNAYLKPADKALLAQLTEQLRARGATGLAGTPAKGQAGADAKESYRTLVTVAREAYNHGDLDTAEAKAKLAEKNAGIFPDWPWSDSAAKVLRDVQASRAKLAAAAKAAQHSQDPKSDSPGMLTKIKTMLPFGATATPTATKDDGAQTVAGPAVTPNIQQVSGQQVSANTLEARQLRDLAIEALKKQPEPDLVAARKYAEMAKAKTDPNIWWDQPTPDQLLASIAMYLPNGSSAKPGSGPAQPAVTVDASNARARLKEARALYSQGKLDEADRLCAQVAAVKLSWGLFEDNPDKLRTDLRAAHQKADKAESVKVLADARKMLAAGNFDEARVKAWKAKQMHGSYSIWDTGDRPDRLLAEIESAEAKAKKSGVDVAKNRPTGPKMDGKDNLPPPASAAGMMAKQRSQGLLEEAHAMQKQGKLAEAVAKAVQARTAAQEAARGGVSFGVGEETPDLFLDGMASQGKVRIDSLMRAATENSSGPADPARLKKALDNLSEARQLAMLFGLDVVPINAQLNIIAQRQQNPGAPLPPDHTQTASLGKRLLDDSRTAIKAGKLHEARKMAEEAFDPKYGVQPEAEMVLRSIDIEEFAQQSLQADYAFQAANDAFLRKDYATARAIIANLDERRLSQQSRSRLREIAVSMPAQDGDKNIKLVGTQINADPPPGNAKATDLNPGGKIADADFERIRAMARVEFDMLTKEGLAAQRTAQERAKAGDFDAAIDILRAYSARLSESKLPPEQLVVLRKAGDRYIEQYQTRKAQAQLTREMYETEHGATDRERKRLQEQQELNKKIAKMVDDANKLMKEGKFAQAAVAWAQIQDIDPDNLTAQQGRFIANVQLQEQHNTEIQHNKDWFELRGLDGDPGTYVDFGQYKFDKDRWDRVVKNRKGYEQGIKTQLRDPVERNIQRALVERKLTLSLDNVPLYQAVQAIREMVGDIDILIDDKSLAEDGVRMDRPLSMTVHDMSLRYVLDNLLKKVGLVYVIQSGCINITTEANARGRQNLVVYSVADLVVPMLSERSPLVELDQARWKHAINQQLNGGLPYGATPYTGPFSLPNGHTVGAASGAAAGGQANTLTGRPPKPEGNQAMDDLLISLITHCIAPETWDTNGGKGTIQFYPLGLALVVNQQQEIQEQIVELLQALRRLQDLEVAIEMRLVSVSEAFFEYMGVNFDINILHGSTRFEPELLSGNFAPANLINEFRPASFWSGLTPAGTFTPDLGVPIKGSSFDFALPPFGGFPGTLGADGGISLGLAFLSDVQVFMFMEAAQGDRRTNVMQAPKITVFNGESANINVGDELAFLDQINVVQINGQNVFQPVQNLQGYGVFMQVTPVVSADRRFVRLNLQPTLRNLISATVPLLPIQQIVPQLFFDNFSPPQPQVFQLFFQQPSSAFVNLSTTVVVPDGGTVLMGGLKTLVEGRNEFGPPVLSKIPYISRLFKNVGYGREAQSLMIMVTARIIINEEEEQEFLGNIPRIPR
jgi:Flp pilus assembly secretin CpaC